MENIKFKYILEQIDTGERLLSPVISIEEIEEYGHVIETILNKMPCKGGCVDGSNTDKMCYCWDDWVNNSKIIKRLLSTNLFDNNNNEIYEGDLLSNSENNNIFEVIFKDGCFVVKHKNKTICTLKTVVKNGCEVVGNIYE